MISIGTLDRRTMVMGGVALVVLAAAAGWYFYGDELLSPPEPPKPVAAVAPKPAAKPAATPAPAAAPATTAAKPAAKAPAQPMPAKPEEAVAEVIARSGLAEIGEALRQSALQGMDAAPDRPAGITPAAAQAYRDAINRVLAPGKTNERIRAELLKSYEPAVVGRFIEVLRQPVNEKMTKLESEKATPEQVKPFFESLRAKPLTTERQQLLGRVDTASHASELAAESSIVVIRGMLEGGLIGAKPAEGAAPAQAEQTLGPLRKGAQTQARAQLAYTYRAASDAELKDYAALLESEAARGGTTTVVSAVKAVLDAAAHELGVEMARVAEEQREAEKVAAVAQEKEKAPTAQAQAEAGKPTAGDQKPAAAKPAASERAAAPQAEIRDAAADEARRAAAEERRRARLPPLYSRYNDVVTAVTMQDHKAAEELLADGKDPDARASNGRTALMIAVELGDLEMVNLLLSRGANPNLRAPGGVNAMSLAREAGAPELQSLLTSHGAKE
jgi:hypothetical protein